MVVLIHIVYELIWRWLGNCRLEVVLSLTAHMSTSQEWETLPLGLLVQLLLEPLYVWLSVADFTSV